MSGDPEAMKAHVPGLVLALGLALAAPSAALGAGNSEESCAVDVDVKMRDFFGSATQDAAVYYTRVINRLAACLDAGECLKEETAIFFFGILVDERFVEKQREKLQTMKSVVAEMRKPGQTACEFNAKIDEPLRKLKRLNDEQGILIEEMAEEHLRSISGTKSPHDDL